MKPLYERSYYSFMMQESESKFYLLVQEIAIKYIINTFPSNFLVKKKVRQNIFLHFISLCQLYLYKAYFSSLCGQFYEMTLELKGDVCGLEFNFK